jgi:hypothetical protein
MQSLRGIQVVVGRADDILESLESSEDRWYNENVFDLMCR